MNNYAKGWASPKRRKTYKFGGKSETDATTTLGTHRKPVAKSSGEKRCRSRRKKNDAINVNMEEMETFYDLTTAPSYQILHP
jgi:hypothetical protein